MDDLISRQQAIDTAKDPIITVEGYEMHNQAVMNDCYLRLPCGICRLTMTDCPKVSEVYSITSTWVSANCEVNIHTNNEVTE